MQARTANFYSPLQRLSSINLLGRTSTPHGRTYPVTINAGQGFGGSAAEPSPQPVQVKSKSQKTIKKLGNVVSTSLNSTNVVVIGDNQDFSEGVANELAPLIGYTPIHTPQLLEKLTGTTVEQIIADEGPGALGAAEAMTLETLSSHLRCCISTCGGGIGAAARDACWQHLHGAITIWLDDEEPEPEGLQNEAYCRADLHMKVKTSGGESHSASEVARATVQEALSAIALLLDKDVELCKKKGLYVRLGCRGDWPNLQPPEWAPGADS